MILGLFFFSIDHPEGVPLLWGITFITGICVISPQNLYGFFVYFLLPEFLLLMNGVIRERNGYEKRDLNMRFPLGVYLISLFHSWRLFAVTILAFFGGLPRVRKWSN